jgi:hypothetical protein
MFQLEVSARGPDLRVDLNGPPTHQLAVAVAALLTRYIYLYGYYDLLDAEAAESWVMLMRNIVLIAVFCSLALELAARGRARETIPADAGTTGARAAP